MFGEGRPAELPAGTVTFLFTDIEGSARRWEAHPAEMPACVDQHDEILRRAVDASGGHVVKKTRDGVMAVFDDPNGAVTAAVDGQREIEAASWGSVPAIRVRMGLHSGPVAPVEGDYVGEVVDRAAHIAQCANGGQIVTSNVTAALVGDRPGIGLRSLGVHELNDLAGRIEVVQVDADGREHEFPPIRTLEAVTHDLPVQRTSFIGRRHELDRLTEALRSSRLVTIVGPGGVGKTRLAIQAAAESAPSFADGVRFIELAGIDRGDDIAGELLDHLPGASVPVGAADPLDALVRRLRGHEMLLVIDNCEHQIDECVHVTGVLLDRCPSINILATSRTPLSVTGEQVVALEPLSVGDHDDVDNDAIRLFVDRAQAAGVVPDDIEGIARICELVDGLPLAIELAAARTPHLGTSDIADRLERHTRLLVSRKSDASERHRSVDALLDWSYELLEPIERELFRRLGVFVGPLDLGQIEAALTGEGITDGDVLELVASLVDRSLLTVLAEPAPVRYTMLTTVRRFAAARLADDGRLDRWREHHARWCLASISADDGDAPEPDERLHRFMERSSDDVVGALHWAASNERSELAWQLVGVSWRWWEMRGRAREGVELFAPIVDEQQPVDDPAWASAVEGIANLAFASGDVERSIRCHERALDVFERHADVGRAAWCRTGLSMAQLLAGTGEPETTARRALDEFHESADARGTGHAHSALAMIAARQGDPGSAEHHYLQALSVLRVNGHRRDAASVLSNLGNLAHDRGDWRRATRFYDGATQLYRDLDDPRGVALILNNLSIVAQRRDDHRQAEQIATEARSIFRNIGDRAGEAACLNNLANLAAERNDPATALALCRDGIEAFKQCADARGVVTGLRNAASLAERWGLARMAWTWRIDAAALLVRLGLHDDARSEVERLAAAAAHHGLPCAATFDEQLDGSTRADDLLIVLDELRDQGPNDQTALSEPDVEAGVADLTSRERELLALVGEGLTNGEIAERLFISQRTVDAHLSHIRTKLGITDRSKLIVAARTTHHESIGNDEPVG